MQVHLNSSDAIFSNSTLSVCEFILPNISCPDDSTLQISVIHAIFPNSMYNINSNNNTLYLQVINNIYTIIIPPGNYNVYTLKTKLNTLLTTYNITVTYDYSVNKYTFSCSSNTFTFLYNNIFKSTCLILFGFSLNNQTPIINNTITSSGMVNLIFNRCICLTTSSFDCSSFITKAPLKNNILASIPITASPYELINYTPNIPHTIDLEKSDLSSIFINIINQDGAYFDFNNCHWSLTLNITNLLYSS